MGVREDIALLLENPIGSFKFALEVRERAKFYSHLSEVFFDQSYYWLWKMAKPNTILLDIGAFIGDTASYFAMHDNIDRILAYEPHEKTFMKLEGNISKLPRDLKQKINIYNKALMGRNGFVKSNNTGITGMNKVELCGGGGK